MRLEEEKREQEKLERLARGKEKQEKIRKKLVQSEITKNVGKLKGKDWEEWKREERKRNLEIKEFKENLWKRWRNEGRNHKNTNLNPSSMTSIPFHHI